MIKDFERLIGENEYSTFISILKSIGATSRTHRISVFIAGFFRYAHNKIGEDYEKGGLEDVLIALDENPYIDGADKDIMFNIVDELCKNAGIQNHKVSESTGDKYSISENVIEEYSKWEHMRWENF